MEAERANRHLSRLALAELVPLVRRGRLLCERRVVPDGERRRAREEDVRERVELDRLDAEDAVVQRGERRRAEKPEKVDEEDSELVLVPAARARKVEHGDRLLEVSSVVCRLWI